MNNQLGDERLIEILFIEIRLSLLTLLRNFKPQLKDEKAYEGIRSKVLLGSPPRQ